MNAKSIYDNLVDVQGVPSSILTYSDKEDCIIIEIQDYNKSVFKFAREFFKGYKSTDIIYTNEDKTAVWYNDVSVYSDRETIEAITDFYYRAKAKGLVESKKSSRKSLKEYEYDTHNKSWVSDSAEKVYTNGLEYKNDWCILSLYKDEYKNLVNYLLDEKGFILEKKYTKKLGYDVFINEKLDLYVVIMNEATYGFFDEKHFIIRFGDELGIETPIEVVEKTLKGVLFETFDLTKNDVDLIKSNVDYIMLKTKEPIDKKSLDDVLNDELNKYHYPISVEVEEKDELICIIWVF